MRHDDYSPAAYAARIWLAVGALLVLCVPAARDMHAAIGWLPIWLVVAPAAALVVLRRAPQAALVRRRPIRR